MSRVVACSFQRFSCGHDLFNATYTRSNRTKGTKIMRCFPHCCPEHMPRCYCGCSLHVLVEFENVENVNLDDIIVCARFETSEEQEPRQVVRLGSTLTIPRILLSRNSDEANATMWIIAEKESEMKQGEVTKNSVLFVMNNHRFPRWYYGYESGATKNQRDMRHHLTAYVLLRSRRTSSESPDTQLVMVLGRLASPAFKLVSYRRARADVKKPKILHHDDPLTALEEAESSSDDEGEFIESAQLTSTKVPSAQDGNSSDSPASTHSETREADVATLVKERTIRHLHSGLRCDEKPRRTNEPEMKRVCHERSTLSRAPIKTEHQPARVSSVPSRKRKADSPTTKRLWWRQYPDDARRVLHLHVLFVLLNRLSLRDVMFCLRGKSDRLRKKWFVAISDAIVPSKDGVVRLAELANGFCLSIFAEDTTNTSSEEDIFEHAASRDVIAMCVEVMLEVGTSSAVKQLLEATWEAYKNRIVESTQIRELFVQFVRRLHGAIDTTLRNRRKDVANPNPTGTTPLPPVNPVNTGVAALVDEAMTAAFREPRLLPLRSDMAKALSESPLAAERWYEVFVAQLRIAWIQHHERKASGISLLWQAALNPRRPIWTGKWVLDAQSYRVRRPGGWFHRQSNDESVAPLGTALSWLVVLRQWLAVELTMDGSMLVVSSLLTVQRTRPIMRLILDERQRVFQSFPDGMSSTICFGGADQRSWLHGDYVGRGRDDTNEILCEIYSMRALSDRSTEMQRLSIKASIWDPTAPTRRCVVSIQLATAICNSFGVSQIVTWPVLARHEQLYTKTNWSIVADIEVAYIDLK